MERLRQVLTHRVAAASIEYRRAIEWRLARLRDPPVFAMVRITKCRRVTRHEIGQGRFAR